MNIPELIRKTGLRRGLSPRTIKTYDHCVGTFFKECNKEPKEVKKKDVIDFLDKLIEKNSAGSTLNVYLNALNFFYREILNRKLMIGIRYSKTPKKLPIVLTKDEIKKLIYSISNSKHKLIVKLMYSTGLRVSELVNLKVKDLEFDKNYGWVRKGKGSKDRLFIIANNLKEELKHFISNKEINHESYLFKGFKNHLSVMSVYRIIKSAAKLSKIQKNVHPHTLRHSFATHLVEDGYDATSVQPLMGHNSVQTTLMYLHIASPSMISVKSPLDSLT
ncbi:hypothetical protein CMO83_04080 [Candidatus Woesearchaeota archaeon]|jgi:site-specific recombinase XerD|nr:hypothetical protein [Candidatus Woesearchaeota archaeon]|tara:strand:+ start:1230 stop:2054 length:825 start_codon:yes stop_codon:yes gene_type:complete